jgi:hypothetical protein
MDEIQHETGKFIIRYKTIFLVNKIKIVTEYRKDSIVKTQERMLPS